MRSQFWDWGALEPKGPHNNKKKWKMRASKNCTHRHLIGINLFNWNQIYNKSTAQLQQNQILFSLIRFFFLEMLKGSNDSNDSVFVFIGKQVQSDAEDVRRWRAGLLFILIEDEGNLRLYMLLLLLCYT